MGFVFEVGKEYSKREIRKVIGLPEDSRGGPLNTGIAEYSDEFLIFANIGTTGRTGHDYDNQWEDEYLRWSHRTKSTIHWPSVQRLLSASRVHVFWRSNNQATFAYAGFAHADCVYETTPVVVLWYVSQYPANEAHRAIPRKVLIEEYREGAVRQVWGNIYERDRAARQTCIDHYGPRCTACGLEFEERYGEVGKGIMHVHHLVPLSDIRKPYRVNPVEDLRPVCPNCHAMVHQRQPPYSPQDVRAMLLE